MEKTLINYIPESYDIDKIKFSKKSSILSIS